MATRVAEHRSVYAALLALVWPVLIEQFLILLVGLSDMLLAGYYLERPHLAAMAMLSYLLWALENLFAVVAIGALAMTARFAGAGDDEGACRVTNQAFVLGAVLAVGATVAGLIGIPVVVRAMQLASPADALAVRYMYWVMPLVPAMMFEAVGIACLRGVGDMKTALAARLVVNVVDIAVSWSLLLGLGPLPKLGWDGLAIGTGCGYGLGGLLLLAVLLRGRRGLQIRWSLLRPDLDLMRRILRIGVPGGFDIMSVIGCQLLFVSLINRLGELATAALGVAIRVESLAYMPGTAFQVAAATLAGQFLGARDFRRATDSVVAACLACGAVMLTAGVGFYYGAEWLAQLFVGTGHPDVVAAAAPLLRIVSVAMLPLGLMMVLSGALRGAGDTRWPLVFTLVGFLAVRLPLTYWLAIHLEWGIVGAWYAMVVDLLFRCALVVYRFWHGGWKRIEV